MFYTAKGAMPGTPQSPPAQADVIHKQYAKLITGDFDCVGRMARDRNSETDNV